MSDFKYKFSVVIPVYNVEKYLAETIDSVIGQTIGFKDNIEIILVNDGSPDNSGAICEKYRDMYPDNIRYFVKENGGVSSARNFGAEYAEGEYINFLDSDDKWDSEAFEKAFNFFEKHGEDIDVVSSRLRFFDAFDGWHVLDYKCDKGSRVVDLTKDSEYSCIQLQTASTFIRREAMKGMRFNEKVKFGEDSLFINGIIFRKMKYGILDDCIYLYRKRADESSATQVQRFTPEYYTVSPQIYYNGIIEESIRHFGEVVPYAQNILAYDIGWRVKVLLPDEVNTDDEFRDNYISFLRDILSHVEDGVYLRSPVHKRLGIKCAFYKLKHGGKELIERSRFDLKKKSVYVDDVRLYNFNKINHAGCVIHICEIEGDTLRVEGVVSRWLLSSCPESKLSLVLKQDDKVCSPELTDYDLLFEESIFGRDKRYYRFTQEFDLSGLSKGGDTTVKAALTVGDELCDITVRYGKFVPDALVFKPCSKVQGDYIVTCTENGITVKKSKNIKKDSKSLEKAKQLWLSENELESIASFRKEVLKFKKKNFRKKKLWIITDRFEKAGDNGEAIFRYLCTSKDVDKNIVPVFAISKNYSRVDELNKIGRVIYFEDEEMYKKYFLCADKLLASSGSDFAVNPLGKEEKPYLSDMINSKLVFLQHGITKDNLSDWLNKFNKNINLFVTAAKNERASILDGDYMYTEKEVKLTGFARYDLLEDKRQKIVAVMPTWRKSIKKSYDINTESVYYDKFNETEYFKFYNSLINDERLLSKMREKGYKGIFCLHPIHTKQYVDYTANDVFSINKGFVNYNRMFSEGALLVTDFSSVFFDFAYLNKPVVYSQFDKDTFFESHSYTEGYFSYEKDGFGPVCTDLDSTVDAIIASLDRDCKIEDKYLERVGNFYGFNDKNNCKRIYEAILNMD